MLTLLEKEYRKSISLHLFKCTNYVNDEGLIQIEKRLILLLTF
jgi:hypothetical protein